MSEEREDIPVVRNLDGAYYRVIRNEKCCSMCFSDLTKEEQHEVTARYDLDSMRRLCEVLCDSLRQIGDELDLYSE